VDISISKAIQAALEHHQSGRLPQAETLYRQILGAEPNHPDALHFLGVLSYQVGKCDIAADLIGKAIRANPSNPMYYNNLGNVLKALGKQEGAIESYRKVILLKPGSAEAHYNLGNALREQGRLGEAVESYHRAVSIKPDFADAHSNMGLALKDMGKLDAAVESFRKTLALQPGFAEAHYDMGNVLQQQGKLDAAIASYRNALSLNPDSSEVHFNLGNALGEQGQFDAAAQSFRRAIVLEPDMAKAYSNLGNAFREQGNSDEAATSFRQALAINPELSEGHLGLANLFIDMGKFGDAEKELAEAIKFKPENPSAWAKLASLRKMTLADEDWLKVALSLAAQSAPPLSENETIALLFAIGKYYDDTGQYDLAFPAYAQGNMLKRRKEGAFDRAAFSLLVDGLIGAYNADFLSQQHAGASPAQLPALIVGMPRSGTSLIEQIIASHPKAFGAGELAFWNGLFMANQANLLSGNHESSFVASAANEYERHLRNYSTEALRIVDKMPGNFLFLGLIHTVFPQAKIIHAQRNPADTCLSIYFQCLNAVHAYSTNLEDLAFFFREYTRLMRHWRTVLPADRFLEVPYEALIEDQPGWSRRIIEFIGLDWDESCLDFHETQRKVKTSSNWQVRQKIYRTSKERWRNYENHIGPLRSLLDLNIN
jgi:tetratricopeptide (TPR) repeat protein